MKGALSNALIGILCCQIVAHISDHIIFTACTFYGQHSHGFSESDDDFSTKADLCHLQMAFECSRTTSCENTQTLMTLDLLAVGRHDHYCTTYMFACKSVKWWRKLLFGLIEDVLKNRYPLMTVDLAVEGVKEP